MLYLRKSIRRLIERARTTPLFEDERLYIRKRGGSGADSVVVFTSLGGNLGNTNTTEFERSASSGGTRHCIFVTDKLMGWYQAPGQAEEVVRQVQADLAGRNGRLMVVGFSLGGYAAMRLASALGADVALAFGPQFHASAEAVPGDPRWPEERARIGTFALGPVDADLSPDIGYYVLHGRMGPDILHYSRFPKAPNIHHFIIPEADHTVTNKFREAGVLYQLVQTAFADDFEAFRRTTWRAGGRLRKAGETYETNPNNWYKTKYEGEPVPLRQASGA